VSWEHTVSLQKVALQELSAPLIPVIDGITIMPLIGTIDTERATQIMENLLEGAIQYNSSVVLIDITGVPVVDTMVAHHIILADDAVLLFCAIIILFWFRSQIFKANFNLSIHVEYFDTESCLKKRFINA